MSYPENMSHSAIVAEIARLNKAAEAARLLAVAECKALIAEFGLTDADIIGQPLEGPEKALEEPSTEQPTNEQPEQLEAPPESITLIL